MTTATPARQKISSRDILNALRSLIKPMKLAKAAITANIPIIARLSLPNDGVMLQPSAMNIAASAKLFNAPVVKGKLTAAHTGLLNAVSKRFAVNRRVIVFSVDFNQFFIVFREFADEFPTHPESEGITSANAETGDTVQADSP